MINSLFRRANRDGSPSTAIEYALIAAGLSIAILVLVGEVGGDLVSTFSKVKAEFYSAETTSWR